MKSNQVQSTIHLLLATMLFLFGGCGAGETDPWTNSLPDNPTDTAERPLNVSAQLEASVTTRAAGNLETGTLAVYRKTTNGYAGLNNIPYTWDDATKSWKSAGATDKTKTIYVDHRDAEVYAYYPYESSRGANTVFNLNMARNTPDKTMLYSSSQSVNNRTATATFAMKSGYSRLTFRIQNTNLPSYRITKATATFASAVKNAGTIDISAATPTTIGSGSVGSYVFPLTAGDSIFDTGIGTAKYDETCDLLMIPGQSVPAITFAIELSMPGASSKFASISATIPAGTVSGNLVQGKQYIIPLLLSGTTLTFNQNISPVLPDAEDQDPFGEDKLTAYTLPPVTVNGLNVATGNLYYYESDIIGSDQNPNYILDGKNNWYCFAGRSGKQYVETKKTATSTFIKDNERCGRLGSNWYCPSASELQTLAGAIRSSYQSYSESGASASGYWIGATSTNKTSAIFLQAGNYVAKDGGYLQVNSSGITFQSGDITGLVRCLSDKAY